MLSYRPSAVVPPAIFLAAAGLLGACRTLPPAAHTPGQAAEEARGRDQPVAAPPSPAHLFPLAAGQWAYRVKSSDRDQPARGVIRLHRVHDDPAFPWRRRTVDGRTEHLGTGADGAILVRSVEEPAWDSHTVYDPPLPLVPGDLTPGNQTVRQARMTVYSLKNPRKTKNRGTCRVVITAAAARPLRVGSRTYSAIRIHIEYRAKLRLASVKSTCSSSYAPGVGLVAEESEEIVRALVIGWTIRQKLELVEPGNIDGGKNKPPQPPD
ncbi:MAG: hypothetical protein OER86_02870 [Phycisphaerae bacterium]|nr:hypothetical protein [Phycisphaerae bacterium]